MTTTSAAATDGNGSVIHDIGYKPYSGERLGRAHIVRALYLFSLRAAFGYGRGARARIIPALCFVAILLPAAISIYKIASTGGEPVVSYANYANDTSLLMIVFIAVAAPELVSRDLRHHTLPLYFSRPLRRTDYPLAKLLALAAAIFLLEAVPLLLMYLGSIASDTSGSAVWHQTRELVPGLLVALAYGLAFAPLALLVASTTGRRAMATGAIAILFLATTAISHVFESVGTHDGPPPTSQGAPVTPGQGSGPDAGAAVPDNSGGSGPPDGSGGSSFEEIRIHRTYDSIARYGGLIDPLRLVEGSRIWALHATDGNMPDPGSAGPVYVLELILLTGLTTGGLFLRYRRVGVA
ncbi:MAG: ABC transporter permease [Actinocrinis sp.]